MMIAVTPSSESHESGDVIFNRRGIGYFVNEGAIEKITAMRRESFMNEQLADFFDEIDMLKIPIETIVELYKNRNKQ